MTEGQHAAWEALGPRYLIDVERAGPAMSVAGGSRLDLMELYGREAPLVIEIGSGQGQQVLHAATERPERNYLAIEVFRSGLARTMLGAEELGLRNVRLVEANAPEFLEKLVPQGAVQELWVFFPDPWHKTKHHKRRLVSADFAKLAARTLAAGGVLRLATDWEEYAEQMREVLDGAEDFTRAFEGEWAPRFEGRLVTAFERKGTAKGRQIRDLSYRRVEP